MYSTHKTSMTPNTHNRISLIAAIGKNLALGKDGQLLWSIPEDLKRFKQLTDGHPVIMGRKTWESLPERFRPLPNRTNIVVSRDSSYEATGAVVATSLVEAFEKALSAFGAEEVFVIGGAQIYTEALPFATRLYLTAINEEKEGDVFFPEYKNEFTKFISETTHDWNGLEYTWTDLERD
jgi:dihydrofolate reductase